MCAFFEENKVNEWESNGAVMDVEDVYTVHGKTVKNKNEIPPSNSGWNSL